MWFNIQLTLKRIGYRKIILLGLFKVATYKVICSVYNNSTTEDKQYLTMDCNSHRDQFCEKKLCKSPWLSGYRD